MKLLKICIVVPLLMITSAFSASADDRDAVTAAAKDYILGFYEGDTARLERALHPTLRKLGWYRNGADKPYGGPYTMSFEEALGFAPEFAASDDNKGPDGHLKVTLFEVLDKTASLKVEATWGIDYVHLVKLDDRWVIMNVIWQSYPDGNGR